jgi:phosphopentomutase
MQKRCLLIILDGLGVGELPDAEKFGDKGANTLGSIYNSRKPLIPNLISLGLGNIINLNNVINREECIGCYGKMAEKSNGKDSTIGHWEIAGIISDDPFPVYPDGFNDVIIGKFLNLTGFAGILGNKTASGTAIIEELGIEHYETGKPIVYTSADSVFQIAAHEDIIPLDVLYKACTIAREKVLVGKDAVARVIARPFKGEKGKFYRTANRRDFSLKPPKDTFLDILGNNAVNTIGIGKIDDLFAGQGLNIKIHTKSNAEGIEQILEALKKYDSGLIFINLVDFDMLYGHRNDANGFSEALEYFDKKLTDIFSNLADNDLMIITADHGNDPGDISTDHTREYVPVLAYSKTAKKRVNLGIRKSFKDIAETILDFFEVESGFKGDSFKKMMF